MVLSVEEADKQADKLLKEMYPEQYPEDDDTNKEDEDKVNDDDHKEDDVDKAEDDKTSDDGGHVEEDQKAKSDDSGWEQRYKVLKGKYDKEVPELHRTVRELQESVQALRETISTKKAEKKATIEEEKTDDPDIKYLEEEFPDIHRAVAKMLDSKKPKDEKVSERLQSVEQRQIEQSKERFFKDLSDAVPDWQEIRDDERFVEWLNEIDELTEAPRYQLAVIAQNNLNGKQLSKFYNRFKQEVLKVEPTGKSEKDLEKHTGMPKSKSSKQPDIKGKESDIVTREDIKKFYKDAASGRYVGDEDAFKRMETKIHRAMQEGRIQ